MTRNYCRVYVDCGLFYRRNGLKSELEFLLAWLCVISLLLGLESPLSNG